MLVISLALLSLIKHSIFTIAVVTVILIAVDNVFRKRRFPWIVLAFAGSIFFFGVSRPAAQWVLAVPTRRVWVVSGYTDATMRWQPTDKVDVLRFWEVAIALCALVAYGLFGLLPLLGFAFIVFAAFNHGYVRHDEHEVAATNLLLLAALLWLPIAWWIVIRCFIGQRVFR